MNYIILLISSIFAALGQIFLKLGANQNIYEMLLSIKLWIGLTLYVVGSALWIYVLSKEPLSKVYPFAALTFILVFVFSYLFLNEMISMTQVLGILFILVGFVVLALAS